MPNKTTKTAPRSESDSWPKIKITYVGRRGDEAGGSVAHYYLRDGDANQPMAFKTKLDRRHSIGGVYEVAYKDHSVITPKLGGYVSHHPTRADVVQWEMLDRAVDAASDMANASGRATRAIVEAQLGPVRVAYRKLGRAGRAAMIGQIIEYLNEKDVDAERALADALAKMNSMNDRLSSMTNRVRASTREIEEKE